jgi:hypothetical protein
MTESRHEDAADDELPEPLAQERRAIARQDEGVVRNLPGGARSDDREERIETGNVGREEPYEG